MSDKRAVLVSALILGLFIAIFTAASLLLPGAYNP